MKYLTIIKSLFLYIGQYLHEKKRIHKLYNILRQNEYFKMVVTDEDEKKSELKDIKDIKLTPVLDAQKDVKMNGHEFYRCCMDSDSKLLAVEGIKSSVQLFV